MKKGPVISRCLFIAGGDAPESLETVKETLYFVSHSIFIEVQQARLFPIGFVGNDGNHASGFDCVNESVRIIRRVGETEFSLGMLEKLLRHHDIVSLARCYFQMQWQAS